MNEKKVFGYRDLNDRINLEIFGINFNIKVTDDLFKRIQDFQKNANNYEDGDMKIVEDFVNEILGENAYTDIREKYKEDTGEEIGMMAWLKVAVFIRDSFNGYIETVNNRVQSNRRPMGNYYQGNRNYRRRSRRY